MERVEHLLSSEDLHPIDIVETLAEHHEWEFDRVADDQIAMAIEGSWRTYSLSLSWCPQDETLRLICSFEMEPPAESYPALWEALDLANDKIWSGAFTLWREQKLMVFRYGLNLAGEAQASAAQIDDMVCAAVVACERFYPAFQLVCWGNEKPSKALNIALGEAYGRA